ncbi:hypothetical protein BJ138DRAFT_1112061 [Hygrophoropsis aurantiaca]|uniref:Uncharacterized protein n=1 Tax=Hygrophoropsis aurantiaca TaxID=72124 RepID=A0ACB8AHZ4_9AGAM|nr:hypothetical protein BJ138DRAFT_1112061 [Hygrophoropsis aurantiaca]
MNPAPSHSFSYPPTKKSFGHGSQAEESCETLTPRPREAPSRAPAPKYRHAVPSGPWPWVDFNSDFETVNEDAPRIYTGRSLAHLTSQDDESDVTWKGYPQSLFGNWTPDQVKRSQILTSCSQSEECLTYRIDVMEDGRFVDRPLSQDPRTRADAWKIRPDGLRLRALFVDNLSVSVMKMLGTQYNIEPFFFSSSVNWTPSQYQEDPQPGIGDHITITLPFIRVMLHAITPGNSSITATSDPNLSRRRELKVIDTQASLHLSSTDSVLLTDLLAIHMVRTSAPESSTIISYHPSVCTGRTSSKLLHSLILRASQSVYWTKIFSASNDSTFILLAMLWYALYAWDEAFEMLYTHINELESRVIETNETSLTRDLHILQAHLLHYVSLLQEFQKSVTFVLNTPNPAMDGPSWTQQERELSKALMKKECNNLLSEIERLQGRRHMQSSRLKNVMDLAFASVNIEDSKHMRRLTEATVRDSAAMRQISYLTMIFLPASFIAAVFGMNVKEINPGSFETLTHYVEASIVLTILTAWIVVALQSKSPLHETEDEGFWTRRLWWPVLFLRRKIRKHKKANRDPEKGIARNARLD